MSLSRTRRMFLSGSAMAGLAGQLKAAPGDEYWSLVRKHFSFSDERVPMNAANLCPSPRIVADRVVDLTRDMDFDCSFRNRAKFETLLEQSRAHVAGQLGAEADEIALVRNTSEANNIINNGLPLASGDEVLLWDQNHPTNNVAWDVRAARFGIVVKRVTLPGPVKDKEQIIDTFAKAITPRTKVLSITYVSNTSGIRLPAPELCQLARRRGLYIHIDGAQTWGALRIDLHRLDCDSYSASAHKWFMGPREVGVLYVRKDRIPQIWPNTVAPGWGTDATPDVAGARKFESLGQRDDARLAAIKTAAEFHTLLGPDRIEARMLELASALKRRVAELGVRVDTPLDPALSAGVCILRAPAEKAKEAYETLDAKFGIAGAATGGVRLCPHIYNTMEHIDRAVAGIRSLRHLFG